MEFYDFWCSGGSEIEEKSSKKRKRKKHTQENDSSPGNMDLGIFSVLCYLSHRKKEDPK